MKQINALMATVAITKTSTLITTFHKPAEEENMYVQFGYVPLTICNNAQGQVLGSMNYYPINMIHTIQQSKREGLNKELKRDLRSSKSTNQSKQV